MNKTALTLEQAREIADDFEDLTETGFLKDGQKWTIRRIAICPFDKADKSLYPHKMEYEYNTEADEPDASWFDVWLLIVTDGESSFSSSIDIRSYAEMMGIKYNFPV